MQSQNNDVNEYRLSELDKHIERINDRTHKVNSILTGYNETLNGITINIVKLLDQVSDITKRMNVLEKDYLKRTVETNFITKIFKQMVYATPVLLFVILLFSALDFRKLTLILKAIS